jgi:hypothetical protein
LKDLNIRADTNKVVIDLVDLDRVRSLLESVSDRRHFLALRQAQEAAAAAEHGMFILRFCQSHTLTDPIPSFLDVPEIVVVEDVPTTPATPPPPVSSRDITSARPLSAATSWTEPDTPTRRDQFFDPSDVASIGGGDSRAGTSSGLSSSSRGLHRDRRYSDMSALSADLGLRYAYVVLASWDLNPYSS